ncbi:hypothetical protein XELAEV_18029437mg [Xenopus laevis]|uniref:Uncharacterized protein n=1 Tax=Xenopus laevis TaxID=8355 RepID=A0A974CS29_XENLA|nr:hypothetical protein XELAEV_18029437mg [Xenopus laevis]
MEDFADRAGLNSEYAETWHVSEADADRVLWTSTQTELPSSTTIKDVGKELTRLKQRIIDLDLHGLFLSDYYRAKKIPRGFRIRNAPTIGRSNPEFCKKWTGVLNRCSLDLIVLVIEEVSHDLTKVRKELTAFENENQALLYSDSSQTVIASCEKQIEQYKMDLLQFKRDKLKRVNEDYSNHKVYRWLSGEKNTNL